MVGVQILIELLFVGFASGLLVVLYIVLKKLGYPRLGISLATIAGLMFLFLTIIIVFNDQLFSESDAQELLLMHQVYLNDQFEIISNKSLSALSDFYHTFTLEISANDKSRIISEIKESDNFTIFTKPNTGRNTHYNSYKTGDTVFWNYENNDEYIREMFIETRKGYAPIWQFIHIDKDGKLLVFEDIVE